MSYSVYYICDCQNEIPRQKQEFSIKQKKIVDIQCLIVLVDITCHEYYKYYIKSIKYPTYAHCVCSYK